jgi:predicted metal-binding membrane protein
MVAIVRDRTIVIVSLLAVAGLAWIYLIGLSQDMSGMEEMPGMAMPSGSAPFSLIAIMWAVMMVGMMLPTALPMILLFIVVQRRQGERPVLTSTAFAAGYLLIWGGFALVAAVLQTELRKAALLSPSLTFLSTKVAGTTFLLAAAYEFSPLKNRCLTQCSSPIGFITAHWYPGFAGAFRMGLLHGAYCVGCCGALMLLLFTAGVMNLIWVAALFLIVLFQKVLPYPRVATTTAGVALVAVGLVLIVL